MIGSRQPDPVEAEAARLACAAIIALLRDDENAARDTNVLSDELAELGLSGNELFGVILQTSASLIHNICAATNTDAVGSVRALMALIGRE